MLSYFNDVGDFQSTSTPTLLLRVIEFTPPKLPKMLFSTKLVKEKVSRGKVYAFKEKKLPICLS